MLSKRTLVCVLGVVSLAACDATPADDELGTNVYQLSGPERRARAIAIRDVAAGRGLVNGPLLAGIAQSETGLSHCWSEATWACKGPNSPSCGGGPVIAGASDGPCSIMQGGLGMYQFDGGTFAETLARDGEDILILEGNIDHAVDFVAQRVIEEESGVNTFQEAMDWMNSINVTAGDPQFTEWVRLVTCRYNGCCSSSATCNARRAKYRDDALLLANEFEPGFWNTTAGGCEPIPAEGRVIDDDDRCAFAGGDPQYWRRVDFGYGEESHWTYTTDLDNEANFAEWQLEFASAGEYEIKIYRNADKTLKSSLASYRVVHARGESDVQIDQNGEEGFVSLGTFFFDAGTSYELHVGDNTGEPNESQLRLYFDAVSVTPATTSSEPTDDPEGGGGCNTGGGHTNFALGLAFLALALGRRRRATF